MYQRPQLLILGLAFLLTVDFWGSRLLFEFFGENQER